MSEREPNGGDGIRFTTKELLLELRGDVKVIDAKLDQKADSSVVNDLSVRVANLETGRETNSLRIDAQVREVDTIRKEVASLRHAIVVAAISLAGSSIVFAATMFVVFQ